MSGDRKAYTLLIVPVERRIQGPRREGYAIRLVLLFLGLLGLTQPSAGQVRASNGAGIESTFDGREVTVTYSEEYRGGRHLSARAPVNMLDVDAATVCDTCFPNINIRLNCKNDTSCFSDGGGVGGEGVTYEIVRCSSVSECESFLNALKEAVSNQDASTYHPISPASSAPSSDKPADEPVIDGSHIPSQIVFETSQPAGMRHEVHDAPRPLLSELGHEYLGIQGTAAGDDGSGKLAQLFDNLAKEPPVVYDSEIKVMPTVNVGPEIGNYGAELFDDVRKGKVENFTDTLRSAARTWFTERYDEMSRDTMSRSLSGQSFDELPETFRRDYSVWEAGVKRMFEPFSLRGGLKLVEAFGGLFELWKEP